MSRQLSIFTFKAKERECPEIYRIQPHLTCVLAIKNVGKRGLFKIEVQVYVDIFEILSNAIWLKAIVYRLLFLKSRDPIFSRSGLPSILNKKNTVETRLSGTTPQLLADPFRFFPCSLPFLFFFSLSLLAVFYLLFPFYRLKKVCINRARNLRSQMCNVRLVREHLLLKIT